MAYKPPLGLVSVITAADGTTRTWSGGAPSAADRPTGASFRTRRGDGFADASLTLARRIDRDYVDLRLYDTLAMVGVDGSTAYEGRLVAQPRSLDTGHSIDVQLAGWMAHAKDQKFTEIYVDRDLGGWGNMGIVRRQSYLSGTWKIFDSSVGADSSATPNPALVMSMTPSWTPRAVVESYYDSGALNKVGAIYYDFLRGTGVSNSWNLYAGSADDNAATNLTSSPDLNTTTPSPGYHTPATARRYGVLQFVANFPTPDAPTYDMFARKLAVYGNHGLTRRGTDPGGFYASDVMKNIASRWCPQLSTAGVKDTTYVIPHLTFKDRTHPYDAFTLLNGFHLWELGVWENKTLTYAPADLTDYMWEVRLSDQNVKVALQGDSTEALANGIVVEYEDFAGTKQVITPLTDTTLADTSPDNEANRHGVTAWTEISLSNRSTAEMATQIGRIALAEFNQPKAPGSITVTGHIRDRAGHWQQGWKVRAGDSVTISDHPNERPRLVTETSWDDSAKTLTISVDSTLNRLDALFDRVASQVAADNLSAP